MTSPTKRVGFDDKIPADSDQNILSTALREAHDSEKWGLLKPFGDMMP